jgi:hypothetical protein
MAQCESFRTLVRATGALRISPNAQAGRRIVVQGLLGFRQRGILRALGDVGSLTNDEGFAQCSIRGFANFSFTALATAGRT